MFFFQFLHILPGLFVSVHNHSPWGDTPSGMDTFYKPNCTCTTTHTQTHTDTQTFIAASPTSLFIFSLFIFSISSIVHTSHPSSSPLPPPRPGELVCVATGLCHPLFQGESALKIHLCGSTSKGRLGPLVELLNYGDGQ